MISGLKTFLLLLMLTCFSFVYSQRGKDGDMVVSTSQVVNEFTSLTLDASSGDQIIQVSNSSMNANGRFSSQLSGGDLILIIQVQGAIIDATTNNISWGEVLDLNNCGNYEMLQVASVPDGTHIALDCPLKNDYTATGKVQIVRVPRYNTLDIQNGGILTTDAWNGTFGGVLAIEVLGNTTINGTMDVSSLGFRGGQLNDNNSWWAAAVYASTDDSRGAEKGEGIVGFQSEYDIYGGMYGRGAGANAGGGGNAHNSGGGGGANAGVVANWTGLGVPDVSSAAYMNAWELEQPGMSMMVSSGGGRGGYSFSANDLDATSVGPNDASWGGDQRRSNGGIGGRPLDYGNNQLFLAGGGGAGDQNDDVGGAGGRGAGLIYLFTYGDVGGTGDVIANGEAGYDTQDSFFLAGKEGAGGGGAGGTIVVNAIGTISGVAFSAVGGKGGDHIVGAFTDEMEGPGGGGGGGYVGVSNNGVNINVSGGINGTTNSFHGTEFLPNGATSGGAGSAEIDLANFDIVEVFDTICKGAQATITAQFDGIVPPGTSIEWYDAPFGGNQIQNGNTFITNPLYADTVFYIGTCPGNFRQTYHVTIDPGAIAEAGNDTSTCIGIPIQLDGSGGSVYAWEPANLVDDPTQPNPVAFPTEDTWFYLTITANNGCTDVDSVFVLLTDGLPVVASGDGGICFGDSILVSATGATSYSWEPSEYFESPNASSSLASPPIDMWLVVTGSVSSGCTGEDSVFVTVTNEIIYTLTEDTVICENTCLDLEVFATGGTNSFTYSWDQGLGNGTSFNECLDTTTMYNVVITDNNTLCQIFDSVQVVVSDFNWNISVDSTCNGYNTTFTDLSTSSGGDIVEWDWDFGDNTGSVLENPINVYETAGDYNVILEVTDEASCSFIDSMVITINQVPTGIISSDITEGCMALSIQLSSNVSGGDNFEWQIGNSITSTGENVTVEIPNAGVYAVSLTATSSEGCQTVFILSDSISVFGLPTAYYIPSEIDSFYFPQEIIILENQSENASQYLWDFGNGITSTDTLGLISYLDEGTFCPILTAIDENGCEASYDTCLLIYENYEIIIPNIFTPNGDGMNDAFEIDGTHAYTYRLEIYNRWGNLIYENPNYNDGWDGTLKGGGRAPAGTYYYVLFVNEEDSIVRKGFLTLLRD